jgi:hypothetical protein
MAGALALLYDNIESEFKQALIGIGSETYSCAQHLFKWRLSSPTKTMTPATIICESMQTNILKQIEIIVQNS